MTTSFAPNYMRGGFDAGMIREDLLSQNEDRQRTAMQQIIAYMTMGKDMAGFFNEVAALTSNQSIPLKRLVYLYLVQNSRLQPEKAVLQAGTFAKDTLHDSPLYRGAALRTMTNLQLPVMADFVTAPLRRCLQDSDAYVRRVAAMAVLKQYCVTTVTSFDTALLDLLKGLLEDDNHTVAATAVQALVELYQRNAPEALLDTIATACPHLLDLLDHANEWSALCLLRGIGLSFRRSPHGGDIQSSSVRLTGNDATTAGAAYLAHGQETLMRVMPWLCSDSVPVTMETIRLIWLFLHRARAHPGIREDQWRGAEARFAPPMVARLLHLMGAAARYEIRYVVLRNLQAMVTLGELTRFFEGEMRQFLIQYDDPVYIKLEKLQLLVRLATPQTGQDVLRELMVYSSDQDIQVSRESIRAIGTLAATQPHLAKRCVEELTTLLAGRVPRIVEDTCVVVQLVLRTYPNQYLDVVPVLCNSLTILRSTEAKAAIAWVVGEYPRAVPNAMEDYLSAFVSNYAQEPIEVQLAVLTALVKMFVRASQEKVQGETQAALEQVLQHCIESNVPDLRDRALFYWRLLARDRKAALAFLTLEPPRLLTSTAAEDTEAMSTMALSSMGSLLSVIQKPLQHILGADAVGSRGLELAGDDAGSDEDEDDNHGLRFPTRGQDAAATAAGGAVGDGKPPASPAFASPTSPAGVMHAPVYYVTLPAESGNGLEVAMRWSQMGTKLVLSCRFRVLPGEDYVKQVTVTQLQLNWNMFGLGVSQVFPSVRVEVGDKPAETSLIVGTNNRRRATQEVPVALQVEPLGVRYCMAPPLSPILLLLPATGCAPAEFVTQWRKLGTTAWSVPPMIAPIRCGLHRMTVNGLRVWGLNLVHRKEVEHKGKSILALFLSAETISHVTVLFEVTVEKDVIVHLAARCSDEVLAAYFGAYVRDSLASSANN